MPVIYSAVQRFDPICGDAWNKFIDWSGLTQLREVISLDGILCPSIFQELAPEDWEHNVQEDFKTQLFRDLDYVLNKAVGNNRVNVLALKQEPTPAELFEFADPRFVFRGFDMIECDGGNISALVNCGGFPKAFSTTDLSEYGLLGDHAKALKVQKLLQAEYPDEQHADCDLWAIWQMSMGPEVVAERA
ncbi:MAG: hypothetical protein WCL32_09470 [Planctomycetota bacterium]